MQDLSTLIFLGFPSHKTILKTRSSSVNLADLERIERASRTVLAGDSQCFWLLSSLLAQLKDDGYRPSDSALFDKNFSSLSAALASQTMMAAGVTDFITSKRRESYLAHAACPIAESVKHELLVAPGTGSLLFDQPLLEKVVTQMKEDSLISSSVSLSNLSKAVSRGRSGSAGNDQYVSPLDQSRPGPSGYCKRAASPARGSFSKRVRRVRGMTLPSGKGKGFQSCPCPAAVGGYLSFHWQVWSDKGADPWVVEVFRCGYRIPFCRTPTLSREPIPYPAYSPSSIRGKALEGEVLSLLEKGAMELAPLPSPGYYTRLFVVMKPS